MFRTYYKKLILSISLLIFLSIMVNADAPNPCPTKDFHNDIYLNQYIDICVNIYYTDTDAFIPCTDCICYINFKTIYNDTVTVDNNLMGYIGSGFYTIQITKPPFQSALTHEDYNYYRYWVNCNSSSSQELGIEAGAFTVLDKNEADPEYDDDTAIIGERPEETDLKNELWNLVGEDPYIIEDFDLVQDFMGGLGDLKTQTLDNVKSVMNNMNDFQKNPFTTFQDIVLTNVSIFTSEMLTAYFLLFFSIEIFICVLAIQQNPNNIMLVINDVAKNNIAVISFLISFMKLLVEFMSVLIKTLIDLGRTILDNLPGWGWITG